MGNKLLIVVDMQNDFITGSLGSEAAQSIVPAVKEKIKECRLAGYSVYVTKDTHFDDYLETEEGKNIPVTHCIMNTWGAEIIDDLQDVLQPYSDEFKGSEVITLNKFTFGCDKLLQLLQDREPIFDEIELIGVCTDICVLANAVIAKSAYTDAHIIVDAECCAGTSEENHQNALRAMEAMQIEIRNAGEATKQNTVNREAVIDSLYDWSNHSMTDAETWHLRQVIGDIRSMPSA